MPRSRVGLDVAGTDLCLLGLLACLLRRVSDVLLGLVAESFKWVHGLDPCEMFLLQCPAGAQKADQRTRWEHALYREDGVILGGAGGGNCRIRGGSMIGRFG